MIELRGGGLASGGGRGASGGGRGAEGEGAGGQTEIRIRNDVSVFFLFAPHKKM